MISSSNIGNEFYKRIYLSNTKIKWRGNISIASLININGIN